ncbi:MAG: serine--tRNA ligase, partial [Acholeplasmataceae bacterium]
MLDLKHIVDNIDSVIEKLNTRGQDFSYLRELVSLSETRKNVIVDVEAKKAFRNETSKKIGALKRNNQDVSEVLKEVETIGTDIKALDETLLQIDTTIKEILLNTPNIPSETTPLGKDEYDNVEIKKYLEPKKFAFQPKDHVELGTQLGILD